MKKRIQIQGFLIFLAVVTSILLSRFLFPSWKKGFLDEFLDALGVSFVLFGFLFRMVARGYKAERSANGKILITDGPYGLMRNPMYFGTLLIGLGIVLILFQWWVFLLFLVVFLAIYIPQINREEDSLSRRFGNAYKDYCKITPKYFPHIFSLFKTDLRDYLFFRWSWVKKELLSLIVATAIIIAIEAWEDVKLFSTQDFIKELLELPLIICFFLIVSFLYAKESIPRKD